MNKLTNCKIALADDDADDQVFFEQALQKVNKDIELAVYNDGCDLMLALLQEDAVLPDIVFLDLDMPRKNGVLCLEEIRAHERLRELPVVILTTSLDQEDIKMAYDKKACLFFHKPEKISTLVAIIQKVLSEKLAPWNPVMF